MTSDWQTFFGRGEMNYKYLMVVMVVVIPAENLDPVPVELLHGKWHFYVGLTPTPTQVWISLLGSEPPSEGPKMVAVKDCSNCCKDSQRKEGLMLPSGKLWFLCYVHLDRLLINVAYGSLVNLYFYLNQKLYQKFDDGEAISLIFICRVRMTKHWEPSVCSK